MTISPESRTRDRHRAMPLGRRPRVEGGPDPESRLFLDNRLSFPFLRTGKVAASFTPSILTPFAATPTPGSKRPSFGCRAGKKSFPFTPFREWARSPRSTRHFSLRHTNLVDRTRVVNRGFPYSSVRLNPRRSRPEDIDEGRTVDLSFEISSTSVIFGTGGDPSAIFDLS